MSPSTPDLVRTLVAAMTPDEQEQVLEFARNLAWAKLPPATPGEKLLSWAANAPPELAEAIADILPEVERIESDQ